MTARGPGGGARLAVSPGAGAATVSGREPEQGVLTDGAGSTEVGRRVADRVEAWGIAVERSTETATSVLVFGRRGGRPVVLKVVKARGEEWRSGEVLDAFEGRGVARGYERAEGAMLLERLIPGRSLASLALGGGDEEATAALAGTIRALSPRPAPDGVPGVEDRGRGFERYAASGDAQVPGDLVAAASRLHAELCRSQGRVRLLHGDLHHENVLLDFRRGWVAIDPKGVVGELEHEVGAALRNPCGRPDLFAEPAVIRRRVDRLAGELGLDRARVVAWAFAQAVLSAIWTVEDEGRIEPGDGRIGLARALRSMLE